MIVAEPFLHMEIVIPGNPTVEGAEEAKTVKCRFLPSEISHYYPGYMFGCMIYMRNGSILMTEHTVDEMDRALDNYWKQYGVLLEKHQQAQKKAIIT